MQKDYQVQFCQEVLVICLEVLLFLIDVVSWNFS